MSNYFLNFRKFIIKRKSIIIPTCLLIGLISIGTARLILRNNFDIINLIPIIFKSFCASLALLFILTSLSVRKIINKGSIQVNEDLGIKRLTKMIPEVWWILLNFFAIYFFLTKTLSGDFHFKLIDDMAKIAIAVITSSLISLWAEIRSKKE